MVAVFDDVRGCRIGAAGLRFSERGERTVRRRRGGAQSRLGRGMATRKLCMGRRSPRSSCLFCFLEARAVLVFLEAGCSLYSLTGKTNKKSGPWKKARACGVARHATPTATFETSTGRGGRSSRVRSNGQHPQACEKAALAKPSPHTRRGDVGGGPNHRRYAQALFALSGGQESRSVAVCQPRLHAWQTLALMPSVISPSDHALQSAARRGSGHTGPLGCVWGAFVFVCFFVQRPPVFL